MDAITIATIIGAAAAGAALALIGCAADAAAGTTRPPVLTITRAIGVIAACTACVITTCILVARTPEELALWAPIAAAAFAGGTGTLIGCAVDVVRAMRARHLTVPARVRRAMASSLRAAGADATLARACAEALAHDADVAAGPAALSAQLRAGARALPDDAPERALAEASARSLALAAEISRRCDRLPGVVDAETLASVVSSAVADASLWR